MTIYIRPDGTISGSNEPLPEKPKEEWTDCAHNYGGYVYGYRIAMKNYENALTAWKESCIDFEDQEIAEDLATEVLYHRAVMNKHDIELKPDTIIENVDAETEVWTDTLTNKPVLRIKDKQ